MYEFHENTTGVLWLFALLCSRFSSLALAFDQVRRGLVSSANYLLL